MTPKYKRVKFDVRTNQIENYKQLILKDNHNDEFNHDLIAIINFLRKYSYMIEAISTSKKNHFLSTMKVVLNVKDDSLLTLSETELSILHQFGY